ncbi:MAG: PD-(D/E)XK nuclease family protein [Candidatus Methanodesulfokora sp.]
MSLKKEFLRLLEEDEEFRLAVAGALGYGEVLRRLEEHDKKFAEILNEIKKLREDFNAEIKKLREDFNTEIEKLREDFNRLSMRVEVTIGSMGKRWGTDLERTVLGIFKEVLEEKGIEPGKVEKLRFVDRDGSLTGIKGRIVDIDVLVRDEKLYLIEVKSRAELDHVEALPLKVKAVEGYLRRSVDKVFLVAVNVDREAYERALELGAEVVCGNVID